MQRFIKAVMLALVFGCASLSASAKDLIIEHVANAGVKISYGDKAVLVDALFGPKTYFNTLNDNEFAALVAKGADISLSTHNHHDHFTAKRVADFLQGNPKAIFVGTPEMGAALHGSVSKQQIRTPALETGESHSFNYRGIKITALDFPHMSPEHDPPTNYGYLVGLGDWVVLHVGDADVNAEVIDRLDLASKNIDVAIIHDLFPTRKTNYAELVERMNANKVVFMHMVDVKAAPMAEWLEANQPSWDMLVTGYEEVRLSN